MPPIYDDCNIYESGFGRVSTLDNNYPTILEGVESYYNDKSGFGEVMALFSTDSTILEEISIDYDENMVATYDCYCDDTYVKVKKVVMTILITLVIIMFTLFQNITLLMWKQFIVFEFLMILPLFRMRRNLLMWIVIKFLCLWIMKRMIYVIVILLNSFMMLLKIIMRGEHMLLHIAIISSFLSLC
jgi:hypothetical protein